ncbi:MAG: flagellar basal body P-ring formation protein FlgA [Spirochaetales bacterium]|nr:flagellar basal body P-ring formation protein FlgA [Spirochaetales bacterium]
MKNKTCTVFLLGLFALDPILSYSLYLRNKVLVQTFPVRIQDLARVEHARQDAETLSQKVVIASLEEPLYLTADRFKEALKDTPLERVFGAGVWVVPLTGTLEGTGLKDRLEAEIRTREGGNVYLQSHVVRLDSTARLSLPVSARSLIFQFPASLRSFSAGRRVLAVDIMGQEKPGKNPRVLHRQQIGLWIYKKKQVAVAKHDLAMGHRLKSDDFELVEKEIDGDDARYASGNLVGLRVMQNVKTGDVLLRSVVQAMPLIRRGQQLTLVVQKPGIVLKSRSVALSDAESGGTLRVRPLLPGGQNRSGVTARVIDEDHAVLEGP